jgi:hypothetical protein
MVGENLQRKKNEKNPDFFFRFLNDALSEFGIKKHTEPMKKSENHGESSFQTRCSNSMIMIRERSIEIVR